MATAGKIGLLISYLYLAVIAQLVKTILCVHSCTRSGVRILKLLSLLGKW